MKFALQDPLIKRFLWLPVGVFLVIGVLFVAIDYGFTYQVNKTQQQLKTQTAALDNIMRQVKFLRYQEQLYLTYGDKYQQLISHGLIHRQDRVRWTDILLSIQKELALKPFQFQYEPEQKLTQTYLEQIKIKKDIFYFTRLNITVGLHTDLDILRLIDAIAEKITPLFVVEKCHMGVTLNHLESPKFNPDNGMINAKCSFILFEAKPNPFKAVD